MTEPERAAFLDARSRGLGGSDAASLLQHILPEIKYGCRRRLFYDKGRHEKDFQREETGPMKLGNILEPVLCEEFSKRTGRRIEQVGQQAHPDFPEMVGHVDRMQYAPEKDGPGVLECKALGTRVFYETKRNGLPLEYLLQLQWYFCVTNATWGSFIIGNRDNLALLYFDVERDDKICEAMVREAPLFWASLGNPEMIPDRREPDSFVCQSCEYRLTCHGSALMPASEPDDIPTAPELTPLAAEYLERKLYLDAAEEAVAETKEVIMLMLGDRQAVRVPVGGVLRPIYWRTQDGKPMYAEAVKSMSVQYNAMRERLIKLGDPGAEAIPMPGSFVKRGKQSRPLMCQYLAPKEKKDEA